MKSRINELKEEISRMAAANADELEALRIKYLSKKVRYRSFSTIFAM